MLEYPSPPLRHNRCLSSATEQRPKSHNYKRCSTYIARASPTEATIIEFKSKAEQSDNVPLSRPENGLCWRVIRTTYFVNLPRNYPTIDHVRWNLHPLYTHEPPPTALAHVVFIWSIGICAVTVLTCICIPTHPTPPQQATPFKSCIWNQHVRTRHSRSGYYATCEGDTEETDCVDGRQMVESALLNWIRDSRMRRENLITDTNMVIFRMTRE